MDQPQSSTSFLIRPHITLRQSLARLLKADLIERQWIGNEQFGRFLYTRKAGA
jgi:hypothetical protein